jgi:uncharacterized protein (DUF302 family)
MTDGIVIKDCPWTVPETVERFERLIADKGLKLFAVVDHSGAAAENGIELRDTKVVMFGSPVAGTPVMEAVPLAALDLPLKVLVWDDSDQTRLAYTAPEELARRFGLSDELEERLSAIHVLTDALIAG